MFPGQHYLPAHNQTSQKCKDVDFRKCWYWYGVSSSRLSSVWSELTLHQERRILQKVGPAYRHVSSNFYSSHLVQNIFQELNYINKCHSIATSHRKGEDSTQFKGKYMPICQEANDYSLQQKHRELGVQLMADHKLTMYKSLGQITAPRQTQRNIYGIIQSL